MWDSSSGTVRSGDALCSSWRERAQYPEARRIFPTNPPELAILPRHVAVSLSLSTIKSRVSFRIPQTVSDSKRNLLDGKLAGQLTRGNDFGYTMPDWQFSHTQPASNAVFGTFPGEAKTAVKAKCQGEQTIIVCLSNGWNFFKQNQRDHLMENLRLKQPDEVLLPPMCTLWSRVQKLNRCRPRGEEALTT